MKQVPLLPTERIDDLLTYDLKIIQSDEVFSFSLDAVLLARFAVFRQRGESSIYVQAMASFPCCYPHEREPRSGALKFRNVWRIWPCVMPRLTIYR